jgi:hypothetical protein
MVIFTFQPHYPPYALNKRLVDPRVILDAVRTEKHLGPAGNHTLIPWLSSQTT